MSLDLRVSAPQGIFLNELNTKFAAYVGGFGSGKTFVGCLDQALFFGNNTRTVQGYFAPTYRDIRDTFWPTLNEAANALGYRVKIRSANKEAEFYRGNIYYGTTICRSMDDPQSIIGFKIGRALIDEIDILTVDRATTAWRNIIARMRLNIKGVENCVRVTTTPEGFKFVYQQFKKDPQPRYSMVQASTYENEVHLPGDYIASLRESYPAELIDAYLLGQFVNLTSGTVYRSYDRARNRSAETIKDKEPLHIGQDFNVGKMGSVIFVERDTGWHAVKTLTGLQDTPHLVAVLQEQFPGRQITIYPDASGGSRKTVNASVSDISIIRQAGFAIRAAKANPPVKDRILAVNAGFDKQRLWVNDTGARAFAESLEQQAYAKSGEPDKTSGFDHLNDAGGYFVHQQMPVRKPVFMTGIR